MKAQEDTSMDAQPITIAVINTKGGVGKTTCCHHLAAPLVELGYRVALCDLDYQCNLSAGILGPTALECIPHERTTTALFDDSLQPSPQDLIHTTHCRPSRCCRPVGGCRILPFPSQRRWANTSSCCGRFSRKSAVRTTSCCWTAGRRWTS